MRKNKLYSVIDIGSNFMRMLIGEIKSSGELVILEDLKKKTYIGKETFKSGRVEVKSIHKICKVLKGFLKVMRDYDVQDYKAVTTSGIRGAYNKTFILEQIRTETGLNIEIINTSQERFFTYKAIREYAKDIKEMTSSGGLILNIGSGGIEISLYQDGLLMFTEYMNIGAMRLTEVFSEMEKNGFGFYRTIEEYIESKIFKLVRNLGKYNMNYYIGMGGELDTIHKMISKKKSARVEGAQDHISKDDMDEIYKEVFKKSQKEMEDEYEISQNELRLMIPSLVIFHKFMKVSCVDRMYIPKTSLRHGILADILDRRFNTKRNRDFKDDIMNSVWYIAKRYQVDEKHTKKVEEIATEIFESTRGIHKMRSKEGFYLKVAAILHEVGEFISINDYNKHSSNIIMEQDIMGFSNQEFSIIGGIVSNCNYDYVQIFNESDRQMELGDRMTMSKLAAILNLAYALDMSKRQKIRKIDVKLEDKKLIVAVDSYEDMSLERWAFEKTGRTYEETFGIRPVLKLRSDIVE